MGLCLIGHCGGPCGALFHGNGAKPRKNQAVSCKITLRPRPSKTLLQCKNTASASRSAARRTTRWSAARASTPTISACRSRPMAGSSAPAMPTASSRGSTPRPPRAMPGVLGVWTGADLEAAGYKPFICGLPLKSRDGSPLLQTNRMPLATDKVRYVGDADRLRRRRDGGAGARRGRSDRARHRAAAGRDRCRRSGQARRAAALRSHPEQRRARLSLWRHRQNRRGLRRRRACDQARHRQHPRRRGLDGAARRRSAITTRRPSATRCRCRPRACPATRRSWRGS